MIDDPKIGMICKIETKDSFGRKINILQGRPADFFARPGCTFKVSKLVDSCGLHWLNSTRNYELDTIPRKFIVRNHESYKTIIIHLNNTYKSRTR